MFDNLIFETLESRVKENKFFRLQDFGKKFSATDTKELYKINLKKQPEDWYYRKKDVTYNLNSDGYRTCEFKDVDWSNSIVVFGCSHVFGVGVAEDETMPYYLSKFTGHPVVNMGASGTSMTFAFHNASMLRAGYPTPKAVINMWTGIDRTTYYHKRKTENLGVWNIGKDKYMDGWISEDSHARMHALLVSKISKSMWTDTIYFEGSYIEDTAKLLGCWYTGHIKDVGRDLAHHGRLSHQQIAESIARKINS